MAHHRDDFLTGQIDAIQRSVEVIDDCLRNIAMGSEDAETLVGHLAAIKEAAQEVQAAHDAETAVDGWSETYKPPPKAVALLTALLDATDKRERDVKHLAERTQVERAGQYLRQLERVGFVRRNGQNRRLGLNYWAITGAGKACLKKMSADR